MAAAQSLGGFLAWPRASTVHICLDRVAQEPSTTLRYQMNHWTFNRYNSSGAWDAFMPRVANGHKTCFFFSYPSCQKENWFCTVVSSTFINHTIRSIPFTWLNILRSILSLHCSNFGTCNEKSICISKFQIGNPFQFGFLNSFRAFYMFLVLARTKIPNGSQCIYSTWMTILSSSHARMLAYILLSFISIHYSLLFSYSIFVLMLLWQNSNNPIRFTLLLQHGTSYSQ